MSFLIASVKQLNGRMWYLLLDVNECLIQRSLFIFTNKLTPLRNFRNIQSGISFYQYFFFVFVWWELREKIKYFEVKGISCTSSVVDFFCFLTTECMSSVMYMIKLWQAKSTDCRYLHICLWYERESMCHVQLMKYLK